MFEPLLSDPRPDFARLVQVLRGRLEPDHVPLVELFLDTEIRQVLTERYMGQRWAPLEESPELHYKQMVELYWRLGYDYVPVHHWHNFLNQPTADRVEAEDTAALSRGKRGYIVTGHGRIRSWEEFERIPWDQITPNFAPYQPVIRALPPGMKIVVQTTFFQNMGDVLFGYDGLGYMLYDQPDLVAAAFDRWGKITLELIETLMAMDEVGAIFHADDLGYKTSTLVSRQVLRQYLFPWLAKFVAAAHRHGKMFWLHCCGNVYANGVIDDLIDIVGIDAFHAFQDEILPVQQFKARYGQRIAALGGIDLDKLCRLDEPSLRAYIRDILRACLPGGRFALGSGNSITNFTPVENYLVLLEEARNWRP